MKVVEIVWDDAWIESGDMTIKQAEKSKPIKTYTVGYLIAENEHGVTVATDLYEKDKKSAKTINFVPWPMILDYYEYEIQD